MIRSDLNVPTPAIPIPDLAVPYAAPTPCNRHISSCTSARSGRVYLTSEDHCKGNTGLVRCQYANSTWAERRLTIPKKGANLGVSSDAGMSDILMNLRGFRRVYREGATRSNTAGVHARLQVAYTPWQSLKLGGWLPSLACT